MIKKIFSCCAAVLVITVVFLLTSGLKTVQAAGGEKPVTIGKIDYDDLTLQVFKNGNGIVYFSTNGRKNWLEADGEIKNGSEGEYIEMDISWVDPKSDVKLYFKGNKDETAVDVTIPKMITDFKVKFDKIAIDFDFDGYGSCEKFMWRKTSDYNWTEVSFDKSSASYKAFLKNIETLRFKGCKLIFCCIQKTGTDDKNPGERLSNEVKVTIPKQAEAPLIQFDLKKRTVNTKDSWEYYDSKQKKWISCSKNMDLDTLTPEVFSTGGKKGEDVKIKFRFYATDKKAASKSTTLFVPGQNPAPVIGESGDVIFTNDNKKLKISFPGASTELPIEYCIIKKGYAFDEKKAVWKTVKSSKKTLTFSASGAPGGSKIYVRFAGENMSKVKGTDIRLASACTYYEVNWPDKT